MPCQHRCPPPPRRAAWDGVGEPKHPFLPRSPQPGPRGQQATGDRHRLKFSALQGVPCAPCAPPSPLLIISSPAKFRASVWYPDPLGIGSNVVSLKRTSLQTIGWAPATPFVRGIGPTQRQRGKGWDGKHQHERAGGPKGIGPPASVSPGSCHPGGFKKALAGFAHASVCAFYH